MANEVVGEDFLKPEMEDNVQLIWRVNVLKKNYKNIKTGKLRLSVYESHSTDVLEGFGWEILEKDVFDIRLC